MGDRDFDRAATFYEGFATFPVRLRAIIEVTRKWWSTSIDCRAPKLPNHQSYLPNMQGAKTWISVYLPGWRERSVFLTNPEALSCGFPGHIFVTLAVTEVASIPGLHRYDLVLVVSLSIQAAVYLRGLESCDELIVVGLFSLLGLAPEPFKVYYGSWNYPEESWTTVSGVPL